MRGTGKYPMKYFHYFSTSLKMEHSGHFPSSMPQHSPLQRTSGSLWGVCVGEQFASVLVVELTCSPLNTDYRASLSIPPPIHPARPPFKIRKSKRSFHVPPPSTQRPGCKQDANKLGRECWALTALMGDSSWWIGTSPDSQSDAGSCQFALLQETKPHATCTSSGNKGPRYLHVSWDVAARRWDDIHFHLSVMSGLRSVKNAPPRFKSD